jgi:hypothetical protein
MIRIKGFSMKRDLSVFLEKWKDSPDKKPLILKDARQVGKSCLVRDFGEKNFNRLVEVNFEFRPALKIRIPERQGSQKDPPFGIQFSQRNYSVKGNTIQYPLYAISAATKREF